MKYILIDTLNRIKNSMLKEHVYTHVCNSKFVISMLSFLKKEGLILDFYILNNKEVQVLLSKQKFNIKSISTSKQKIYCSYKNIKQILPNFDFTSNILLINTSLGLKSYSEVLNLKIGGEILFEITLKK